MGYDVLIGLEPGRVGRNAHAAVRHALVMVAAVEHLAPAAVCFGLRVHRVV